MKTKILEEDLEAKTRKIESIAKLFPKLLNDENFPKPLISYEMLFRKTYSSPIPPSNANLTKSIFYKKIYSKK